MSVLRTAIIGLGNQAMSDEVPGILGSDRFLIVAVCDPNENAYRRFAAMVPDREVQFFRTIEELFLSADFDLVVAVTPHDVYPEIVERCATQRKHLFKEKPFARDLTEGKKFLNLAQSANIHIMTAFQRRFHPLYNAFKYSVRTLGCIHTVQSLYCVSSKAPNDGWRSRKETAGGGVLIDMGYHVFDLLIWYFSRPLQVQMRSFKCRRGMYDVEDTCMIDFEIEASFRRPSEPERIRGHCLLSCVYPFKDERLIVIGENGAAILTSDRLEVRNRKQEVTDQLECTTKWQTAMINQLDYFADVVTGKKQPYYSTPQFQMENHVPALDACYHSESAGRPVTV